MIRLARPSVKRNQRAISRAAASVWYPHGRRRHRRFREPPYLSAPSWSELTAPATTTTTTNWYTSMRLTKLPLNRSFRVTNNLVLIRMRCQRNQQTECNNTEEGFERFACPSPDDRGFRCIEDRLFCDGYRDCPGGEDEDRVSCMYYRLVSSALIEASIRWLISSLVMSCFSTQPTDRPNRCCLPRNWPCYPINSTHLSCQAHHTNPVLLPHHTHEHTLVEQMKCC